MKVNDVILQTVTRVAFFIIMVFGIYLFLSGHHEPGGGFIGGLVTTAGLVLLYLSFDRETVESGFSPDYIKLAAFGVFLSVSAGIGSFFFGAPFLSQTFDYFDLPLFGETELATVMIFEVGVALAVIGSSMTIILRISEDV